MSIWYHKRKYTQNSAEKGQCSEKRENHFFKFLVFQVFLTRGLRSIFKDFINKLFHSVLFYIAVVFTTGLRTQEVSGEEVWGFSRSPAMDFRPREVPGDGFQVSSGTGWWFPGFGRWIRGFRRDLAVDLRLQEVPGDGFEASGSTWQWFPGFERYRAMVSRLRAVPGDGS